MSKKVDSIKQKNMNPNMDVLNVDLQFDRYLQNSLDDNPYFEDV